VRAFVLFGPSHLAAMGLTLLVPAALVALVRRRRQADAAIRGSLAAILIGAWLAWYVVAWRNGWLTWGDALPMNLCDWTTIATIAALWRADQKSFELAYFWALGGTLQGLLTPDTPYDFPEVRFLIFFVYHGGIIAAVLYLIFGRGLRPWPQSLLRVAGWSLVYLAAAAAVDAALGTNYGFLRAKPPNVSLFAFMPPWPEYIPVLVALGFVSLGLWYAPWFVADRLRLTRGHRLQRMRP
jgi:hypothetical integral membrane protein (TIGR02206 family)